MKSLTGNIDLLLRKNHLIFREFFESHYPALVVFAEKYVLNREVAEDIVQDVFIKVYESDLEFDTLDKLKAYLYSSVRNKSINKLKHDKVIERHKEEEILKSSESFFRDTLIEQETYRILYQTVDKLPTQSRKIILLGLKGFSNPEIAEELNISVNTVKTLKLKSYRALRERLKDYKLALLILLSLLQ